MVDNRGPTRFLLGGLPIQGPALESLSVCIPVLVEHRIMVVSMVLASMKTVDRRSFVVVLHRSLMIPFLACPAGTVIREDRKMAQEDQGRWARPYSKTALVLILDHWVTLPTTMATVLGSSSNSLPRLNHPLVVSLAAMPMVAASVMILATTSPLHSPTVVMHSAVGLEASLNLTSEEKRPMGSMLPKKAAWAMEPTHHH